MHLFDYFKKTKPLLINPDLPFHSLSPVGDAEIEQYENALLWALRNRKKKDIRNVALTGPYGSGKSSILKTFQERYKSEFQFLNISLATFKEELLPENQEEKPKGEGEEGNAGTEQPNGKTKTTDTDVLRLIELSILQQIFYHEEDKTIPDSRFKKIRSFKKSNLIIIAACMLVMLICGFHLFAPETFKKEFHLDLREGQDLFLHMTSVVLIIAGIYVILLRSVRLLNSIKISKFKFHDAEIEVDKGISKSILNNHLDEILYFFEVTRYTVVIIEDLDRFQQTEIFTKLRELNLLINNSKKIKREIVFIYAVRDDMFRDKDRTKFFDFIVPVIPVINSSNSNDMLRDVIIKNKYHISESLVDDISYFIDDMRLLYNIVNEYYIYHERLDKKLPQDKLLAMIVYKNIHPNDFVKLSEDKGELFKVIKNKSVYVKHVQDNLDKQVQEAKAEIIKLEVNKQKDIVELRKLYVLQYIAKSTGIITFNHNGLAVNFQDATSDANFEKLTKDEMQYTFVTHSHSSYFQQHISPLPATFAQIEKEVDPSQAYSVRSAVVTDWGNGKIAGLKAKIASLETEKAAARHLKLMDLVNAGNVKSSLANEKQNLLVNILLRNGYIEEDYSEFTSIFYEGSITKEDRQFLLNVKSQIALGFDFSLKKVGKLIEKINAADFAKHYVLNISLLDYLLAADRTTESHKRSSLITLLADESETSFKFLDDYINHGKYPGKLIRLLYNRWPTLWSYVTTRSGFTYDRKSIYLALIIEHADIKDITASLDLSHIDRDIAEREDFLSLAVPVAKMKELVSKLKIKFKKVNLAGAAKELVDFIYQDNFYEINSEMLARMLNYYSKYDEGMFSRQNYYALKNSGLTHLIKYIDTNLQHYIDNVFLQMPDNISDTEDLVSELLNNENLTTASREKIISRMNIQVSKLDGILPEFHVNLMEALKLKPTWDNLLFWYKENEDQLFDTGIDFISEESNLSELSKIKVTIDLDEDQLTQTKKFLRALVTEDSFDREVYEQVLNAIPYTYSSLDFAHLKANKVSLLIVKSKLSLSPQNFTTLKTSFSPLHIALLTKHHADFVERISEFELEDNDLQLLLESTALKPEEKEAVYLTISAERITRKSVFAKLIGELLIQHPGWQIENPQLIEILSSPLSMANTVKLFNMNFKRFSREEVTSILKIWPSPYSEIAVPGKRPLLDHNEENGFFANNLKTLKYISKVEGERRGIRISTFKK